MQVSFIIPLYNCLPLTQAMLASLQASLPAGLTHEIIFVDDGSTDGTREWLEGLLREIANGTNAAIESKPSETEFEQKLTKAAKGPTPVSSASFPSLSSVQSRDSALRVILNDRNLGYAGANNRGAAAARGEFLALLNNDLLLAPGWLEPMLSVHQRLAGRAGLVGNIQYNARTGVVDHAGIFIDHRGKPQHLTSLPLGRRLRPLDAFWRVDSVTGACALVRRERFFQLGGFDEGFANGGEDVDFCLRSHAAGGVSAVALRSAVRHHVSASPGRKLRNEQNSRRLTLRWRDELARLAARTSWSPHYLASQWTSPHDPADYRVARQALAHALHLRRNPPPAALPGMQAAIDRELARWERLLGPVTGQ